jgi:uncharacterized protein (TIGR02217 family)
MIIADTELPVFPKCPGFGFTSEPTYLVKITTRDGGFEKRDRKWARPLHRYTAVPIKDRVEGDIQDLLEFWHAMGGMEKAFRFSDGIDYKSCKTHLDPSAGDQPFVEVESGETFQLVKVYRVGSAEQVREIRRPIGSTIRIYNELDEAQDDDSWELDEKTGLLTITPTAFDGVPTSWSGEFHVKCRFDGDFAPQLSDRNIHDLRVALTEVRE